MVRGEGVYLYSENGKKYLDFASGIAVNSLGHCHPHLVDMLKQQAEQLWHCSNLYRNPSLENLARRLVQHSFADTVFMTNSGTEAVETGIKMIRRFHYQRGVPRPHIITVSGSFHGRSLACIAAGKNSNATEGYAPLPDGFDQVPFGDFAALAAVVNEHTGGILLETIQGEGGIRLQPKDYLQQIRTLADAQGILLFLDEVQCGIGRTGALFAFEASGITPDIASIAKGIGGGFPVGACLATRRAASGMTRGSHGGTYGGNPLATATANAVLDIMLAPGFMENVLDKGRLLKMELEKLAIRFPALIAEVRGVGLMLGLKMIFPAQETVEKLRENGLLTVAAAEGNTIRILPPLIITGDNIREAIVILTTTLLNS